MNPTFFWLTSGPYPSRVLYSTTSFVDRADFVAWLNRMRSSGNDWIEVPEKCVEKVFGREAFLEIYNYGKPWPK